MPFEQLENGKPSVSVLVAGWPGMGHVGLGAADYLRRMLNARLFARLDVSAYHYPDAIEVQDGLGQLPPPPNQYLYHAQEPPLFIFEGDTQLPGAAGLKVAGELLDFCARFGVQTVYTGAAYAMPMSFRQASTVYGVATNETLKARFAAFGVEPLPEGRITGLNGVLLGLAHQRHMAAACFLATMPQYAVETPNPKASKAIIQVFQRILNKTIDPGEIDVAIAEVDRVLREFETRVTAAIQELKQRAEELADVTDQDKDPEARPEPQEVMERIEQLFEEAHRDRSKAVILKQELDRWELFNMFEDRFLDLFGKKGTDTQARE
jgi:hypothetical protein